MILTRRFGGLRMHGVVTPPEEAERVRVSEDARTEEGTHANTEITDISVERDDDQQRPAA